MIPLYGFLQGDTLGIVLLADEDETTSSLVAKLQASASVRVAPQDGMRLRYKGAVWPKDLKLRALGVTALDRVDVVIDPDGGSS